MNHRLREELAKYGHEEKNEWIKEILRTWVRAEGAGSRIRVIPGSVAEKLERRMNKKYEELTEMEKEKERKKAEDIIEITKKGK